VFPRPASGGWVDGVRRPRARIPVQTGRHRVDRPLGWHGHGAFLPRTSAVGGPPGRGSALPGSGVDFLGLGGSGGTRGGGRGVSSKRAWARVVSHPHGPRPPSPRGPKKLVRALGGGWGRVPSWGPGSTPGCPALVRFDPCGPSFESPILSPLTNVLHALVRQTAGRLVCRSLGGPARAWGRLRLRKLGTTLPTHDFPVRSKIVGCGGIFVAAGRRRIWPTSFSVPARPLPSHPANVRSPPRFDVQRPQYAPADFRSCREAFGAGTTGVRQVHLRGPEGRGPLRAPKSGGGSSGEREGDRFSLVRTGDRRARPRASMRMGHRVPGEPRVILPGRFTFLRGTAEGDLRGRAARVFRLFRRQSTRSSLEPRSGGGGSAGITKAKGRRANHGPVTSSSGVPAPRT